MNHHSNDINLDILLLRYRITNGMKQSDMARLLGCTQSQYSGWENGKKPSKFRDKIIRDIIK